MTEEIVQPLVQEQVPEKMKVKCTNKNCRKCFIVNFKKHPGRKTVKCPFCRTEQQQEFIDSEWAPKVKKFGIQVEMTVDKMRQLLGNLTIMNPYIKDRVDKVTEQQTNLNPKQDLLVGDKKEEKEEESFYSDMHS